MEQKKLRLSDWLGECKAKLNIERSSFFILSVLGTMPLSHYLGIYQEWHRLPMWWSKFVFLLPRNIEMQKLLKLVLAIRQFPNWIRRWQILASCDHILSMCALLQCIHVSFQYQKDNCFLRQICMTLLSKGEPILLKLYISKQNLQI